MKQKVTSPKGNKQKRTKKTKTKTDNPTITVRF